MSISFQSYSNSWALFSCFPWSQSIHQISLSKIPIWSCNPYATLTWDLLKIKCFALYWHPGGACKLQPVLIALYCASLGTISTPIKLVSGKFYSISDCHSSKSCSVCFLSTWDASDLIFFTNHLKFHKLTQWAHVLKYLTVLHKCGYFICQLKNKWVRKFPSSLSILFYSRIPKFPALWFFDWTLSSINYWFLCTSRVPASLDQEWYQCNGLWVLLW